MSARRALRNLHSQTIHHQRPQLPFEIPQVQSNRNDRALIEAPWGVVQTPGRAITLLSLVIQLTAASRPSKILRRSWNVLFLGGWRTDMYCEGFNNFQYPCPMLFICHLRSFCEPHKAFQFLNSSVFKRAAPHKVDAGHHTYCRGSKTANILPPYS